MSGEVEVFLDAMPGETRGVVARGGRYDQLLIQRDSDTPQTRLGARSVGRVAQVDAGLKAAFVDLGAGEPFGFLPLGRETAAVGQKIEVVVVAEPRERKGPTLRRLGPGEGEPRLLAAGPDVAGQLARLAPGVEPQTGLAAIAAGIEAEEEALAQGGVYPELGLDLAVQRTRALIAADIDYIGVAGRDGRRGKGEANAQGLRHAARLIRLNGWGGLAAVDLVGVGHDGAAITKAARAAFGSDPDIVFGPVNRFGVLMLSLPWRATPLEERLAGRDGGLETRALALVRRLRHHMLSDTAVARFVARCAPEEAALAAPLVGQLGPRASIISDPAFAAGRGEIREA